MICLPHAFVAVLSVTLIALSHCGAAKDEENTTYYTFCFWDRFSEWRPAPYNFKVSEIPAELCNAVIYSHVTINVKTGRLELTSEELKHDPEASTKASSYFYNWKWLMPPHGAFAQMKQLKNRNPKLKIWLAVGGPEDPTEKYSQFFSEMHLWKNTASSLAQWLRTYDFDGVVFDFFSGSTTVDDSQRKWDTVKFIYPFLMEIHTKFRDYPEHWRIALTVPAFDSSTQHLLDIKNLNEVVNFFILKTSDCTGFPSGAQLNVTTRNDMTDIERAEFLVENGALRQRIVLDIPFSGQMNSTAGAGLNTVLKGHSGAYTKKQGSLAFFEVCDLIKSRWNWKRYGEELCPFVTLGNKYVAYEDEWSVRWKAKMIMGRKYRGAAVRTVDMDDITGSCTENFYLLKTLRAQLDERSQYVHFYYHTRNKTWEITLNDSDTGKLNVSFTQQPPTHAISTENTNNATTPFPTTTRVDEETGVPERWKPFIPTFYAQTSTSVPARSYNQNLQRTTMPLLSETTTVDTTDNKTTSDALQTESTSKDPQIWEDSLRWRLKENEVSTVIPTSIYITTPDMWKNNQTDKTTVSNEPHKMTLPVGEYPLTRETPPPDDKYSRSIYFTTAAVPLIETSASTSTKETLFTQKTNRINGSVTQEMSPTSNIRRTQSTIIPEGLSRSTIRNNFIHSAETKSPTSTTGMTNYKTTISQSVESVCAQGEFHRLLPHETDCQKFYQCANSIPHLKSCPPKTIFDTAWQVCNWPNLANRPECIS